MNTHKFFPRQSTLPKYLSFFEHLHNAGEFSENVKYGHNVSRALISYLIKYGAVTKIGNGRFKWVGEKPTIQMVLALLEMVAARNKERAVERENVQKMMQPKPIPMQTKIQLQEPVLEAFVPTNRPTKITVEQAIARLKADTENIYEIFVVKRTKI